MNWDAPLTAANGSALGGLAGYRIYYGSSSGNYSGSVYVSGASASSASVSGLGSGTWYFAVSSVDAQGNESSVGYEMSKSL